MHNVVLQGATSAESSYATIHYPVALRYWIFFGQKETLPQLPEREMKNHSK